MRPESLATGIAAVPLVLLSLISSCEARPKSHVHHHNERLPRVVQSTSASSESSPIANPTAGICSKCSALSSMYRLLTLPIDPNNILARAVAGIPLDDEACAPNASAPRSSVDIIVPASAPTQTVTLEVREEFRWPGWNHGPHFEHVTHTRSRRAATSTTGKSRFEIFFPL